MDEADHAASSRTWTRLPDGVCQIRSRVRRARPEVERPVRSDSRSAVVSSSGSSSTNSFISFASGTLTIVWPGLGEPERLLRVLDRPGLVEAVEEGAVAVRRRVPPPGWRACRGSRCRRRTASRSRRGRRPRTRARRAATGRPGSGAAGIDRGASTVLHWSLVVLSADAVRPAASRRGRRRPRRRRRPCSAPTPAPRSTPSTKPNRPARPAATPDDGVLDHGGAARDRRASRRAASRNMSGAGLPARPSSDGDVAVDDDRKPLSRVRPPQHLGRVARRRHHGGGDAAARRAGRARPTEPGYGAMPSRRSTAENSSFLRLPSAHTVVVAGRVRRIALRERRCRARASTDRTPS